MHAVASPSATPGRRVYGAWRWHADEDSGARRRLLRATACLPHSYSCIKTKGLGASKARAVVRRSHRASSERHRECRAAVWLAVVARGARYRLHVFSTSMPGEDAPGTGRRQFPAPVEKEGGPGSDGGDAGNSKQPRTFDMMTTEQCYREFPTHIRCGTAPALTAAQRCPGCLMSPASLPPSLAGQTTWTRRCPFWSKWPRKTPSPEGWP